MVDGRYDWVLQLSSLVAHPLLGRDGQLGAGQVGVVDLLQSGQSEHVRILVTGDTNNSYLLLIVRVTCLSLYTGSNELMSGQENMCSESHMQFWLACNHH